MLTKINKKTKGLCVAVYQYIRIFIYKAVSDGTVKGKVKLHQPLLTQGEGTIEFSIGVNIGVKSSPFFLSSYSYIEPRRTGAKIKIGKNCWINNNFTAIAESSEISIGENCLIGANVEVYDSDFHVLNYQDRGKGNPSENSKAVNIGENVFIGSNVKIMKGVQVGIGAVISHGSVVVNNVESMTVVGGVPAKVIKTIE